MNPEAREPYETLAGAYDGLTTDVDYAAVLQFFETVLQRAGHSPKTVLDLACGTGSMSVLLAERAIASIGADISEEMPDGRRTEGCQHGGKPAVLHLPSPCSA